MVKRGEGDRCERRGDGDEVGHGRLGLGSEAAGVAGAGHADDGEVGAERGQAVEDAAEARGLLGRAVAGAPGRPAVGAVAERDEPLAGGGRRHREHRRREAGRREVDPTVRRRVRPCRRAERDVDDRRRDAAEEVLEVEAAVQLPGGEAVAVDRRRRSG